MTRTCAGPPWGGPEYLFQAVYSLDSMTPLADRLKAHCVLFTPQHRRYAADPACRSRWARGGGAAGAQPEVEDGDCVLWGWGCQDCMRGLHDKQHTMRFKTKA